MLEAHQRALDNFRTVSLDSALVMSVPTGILYTLGTTAAGGATGGVGLALQATGLAIAGITWWGKTRSDAARVASLPGHFVFEANRMFGGKRPIL